MREAADVFPFPASAAHEQRTAELLTAAEARIRAALALAGDESTDRLDWLDRDSICRDLSEALRLIREAREGEPTAAS